MPTLLTLSLVLNVAVLIPVCTGLFLDVGWTRAAYGGPSPARGLLLSIYVAILLLSVAALALPMRPMAAGLLLVQIVYKVLSPFATGAPRNPVVLSNLAIAAFHALTLSRIGLGPA